jgi:hypothetical protein
MSGESTRASLVKSALLGGELSWQALSAAEASYSHLRRDMLAMAIWTSVLVVVCTAIGALLWTTVTPGTAIVHAFAAVWGYTSITIVLYVVVRQLVGIEPSPGFVLARAALLGFPIIASGLFNVLGPPVLGATAAVAAAIVTGRSASIGSRMLAPSISRSQSGGFVATVIGAALFPPLTAAYFRFLVSS